MMELHRSYGRNQWQMSSEDLNRDASRPTLLQNFKSAHHNKKVWLSSSTLYSMSNEATAGNANCYGMKLCSKLSIITSINYGCIKLNKL